MRSLQYSRFGAAAEVLGVADVARPEPGEGQVLIRTILSPIHNHDLWTISGNYGYKPALPAIGGSEAVGVIEAVGPGVDGALAGKRVVANGAGTWAEFYLAAANTIVPVPDAIGDEAASQLLSMPFSAISLLEFLDVGKGDWVIQTAANGAVGKVFYGLARARGVNVLNLVRRQAAADELAQAGMENVISTDADDWVAQARAIIGEDGARAAVDSVGGKLVSDLATLLGYKGLLVTFGTATGEPMALDSGPIIFKQLTIKGFWGAKVTGELAGADKARMIGELVSLAAKGQLPLDVDGIYGLDDYAAAVAAAQTPGRKGKVLFKTGAS
ncbi:zinc-binding dehydrogenase [Pelagibacterium halotolerans]|uniref:enoyl-[acyl-carrier-protein] reductase n=1 Tax=Pelagibacterium halotolerans (strain DSM 22347 / JCM 15775 / CGMCC 1.7692 / B2) TaxID=1082931 RepID=G4R7Z4_PELHB|nr:zinc-binding dehydrogenase [Pelagibacterium halotolerans]AEQ50289.1 nuclear receptor binding factor related protein [Pelagibacterium halotolerans B2]QJR19720.1 zinc-binding dehydrogenase [Pelagibacterium halotolerans]SEA52777.1 NADPH:quinone reductase [Pelagibacterium halotolerans]